MNNLASNIVIEETLKMFKEKDQKFINELVYLNNVFFKKYKIDESLKNNLLRRLIINSIDENNKFNTFLFKESVKNFDESRKILDLAIVNTKVYDETNITHDNLTNDINTIFSNLNIKLKDYTTHNTKNFQTKLNEIFSSLLKNLNREYGERESISELNKKIIELSKNCASLFIHSSGEKIDTYMNIMHDYKKYIIEKLKTENILNKDVMIQYFENEKVGDILLKNPTTAISNKKVLATNFELFKSKKLSDAVQLTDFNIEKNKELFDKYANFSLNPKTKDLIHIFTKRTSSFGISPITLVNTLDVLDVNLNKYKKSIGKSKGDERIAETLINAENFGVIEDVSIKNIKTNCKTICSMLSNFLPYESVIDLLKNNLSIITTTPSILANAITEIYLNNKDPKNISIEISNLLNKSFIKTESNSKSSLTKTVKSEK